MKTKINLWKCDFCREKNTDLKNKSKDGYIICPNCGKKNWVPYFSNQT